MSKKNLQLLQNYVTNVGLGYMSTISAKDMFELPKQDLLLMANFSHSLHKTILVGKNYDSPALVLPVGKELSSTLLSLQSLKELNNGKVM